MQKTKQPIEPQLEEEVSDVDRLSIQSEIEAQKVLNRIETDRVLINKIEMLLVVLEHDKIDNVDAMPIKKKLIRLVNRM